jgi:hypothetical protein
MYNWTKEEIEHLHTIKSDKDFDRIAVTIGRTREAVKTKANRMGIYAYPELTEYHKQIPENIKAYLSGHFDGEGCVMLGKKHSGKLRRRLILSVTNAHLPALELYQNFFNGSLLESKNGTNKNLFRWECKKINDVYNFIMAILPFSLEKKEQILVAKDWIERRVAERKTVKLSNDFIQFSENASDMLKQLKKL